ncbi:MAG: rhomboid family intramembrane serine protease [Bacteroidaceae bacterium]|nr:rhomboid family intramembrane serine protease [Bacteroidaceae bacterium]
MIDIKQLYRTFTAKNINLQFIYCNIAVFLFISFAALVHWLFQLTSAPLTNSFMLYSNVGHFLQKPWGIFTYMFLHEQLSHLFFNMICLYGFGQLFLLFFSSKHYRGVYIWGGLLGGLLYLLVYNLFPAMANQGDIPLLGASASILALITAVAYREPNYQVQLFLLGRWPLKYIAIGFVVLDLLLMPSSNTGGHVAHLGGAIAGLLFTYGLNKGVDLTAWITTPLQRLINWVETIFSKERKRPKMKVHYGSRERDYQYKAEQKRDTAKIDTILDKLKKSGYESLTAAEKKALFDASKK